MWGESSKSCENDCQCSGLITENFTINSGNSATKRRRDEALLTNFKYKMTPHSLNLTNSPQSPNTPKRRILGELQNSPIFKSVHNSPYKKSPLSEIQNTSFKRFESTFKETPSKFKSSPLDQKSPQLFRNPLLENSPLTTRFRSTNKISKIFEERNKFKMSNKENFDVKFEEETSDVAFGFEYHREASWTATKLDFTDVLQSSYKEEKESFVPEKEIELDQDFETLHDLEEEFDADNFDQCTKYEIISTDSPDIISRGRTGARKINSKNFSFGAPLAETEQSTSFNRPNVTATRALNFEDSMFELPSPVIKKSASSGSVKKSLKFSETPTKSLRHESDSSLTSPASTKLRLFPSESTTSMESGFVSEFEEPFLEIEESNSPKIANFNDLLSGQIKENFISKDFIKRPLCRSMSFNPKAKVSLLSILESPSQERRTQKRSEPSEVEVLENKRRKCEETRVSRPVLQRAFSENNASIMSALDRSEVIPDLIGDFSQPFALPLTSGNHSDLKSISCDTLASLLKGDYENSIGNFQVIDCRYPYEFEGGHITGAQNLFTPTQILSLVQAPRESTDRTILVFHCEFSLERGPKLSRFLRSSDREKNKEHYPSLHYPEVYLLHEGYRSFYKKYPDLCSPPGYTPMLDPKHKHLLKQHRSVQQPSSSTHHRRNRLLF